MWFVLIEVHGETFDSGNARWPYTFLYIVWHLYVLHLLLWSHVLLFELSTSPFVCVIVVVSSCGLYLLHLSFLYLRSVSLVFLPFQLPHSPPPCFTDTFCWVLTIWNYRIFFTCNSGFVCTELLSSSYVSSTVFTLDMKNKIYFVSMGWKVKPD